MVPQARARTRHCTLRQWVVDRRSHRCLAHSLDLFSMGLAPSLCHSGDSWISMVAGLAPDVSPARISSPDQRVGAANDSSGQTGIEPANLKPRPPELACP